MNFLNEYTLKHISFLLSLVAFVFPFFLKGTPCMLCLVERSIFLMIFLSLIAKEYYSSFKYLTLALSFALILIAIYHTSLYFQVFQNPKFCKLETSFFKKTLSACNKANPALTFTTAVFGIILFVLNF